ncbi:MAG TPA: ABC transporter ATP-binding protein [Pseudonocardiaceae bacterium]|jgi:ATP-binding cassette subfamily B protein
MSQPEAVPAGRPTVRSLARLRPYLRPYRGRLRMATALAALASILALAMPQVLRWLVDGPVAHRSPSEVALGGLALLLLGVAEAAIFGIRRSLVAAPLAEIEARLRADLHRHVQRLPISFHDGWADGQLLARGTTDLQVLHLFVAEPLTFLPVFAATFAVGAAVLLTEEWLLALIVLAPVPLLVVLSHRFRSGYALATRRAQDLSGDLTTAVLESVTGIRVIKGFRRGDDRVARFREQVRLVRDAEVHKAGLLGGMSALITSLPGLAAAGALALGIVEVVDGSLSTGTLLAFLGTVAALTPAVEQAGPMLADCQDAAAAADRFFDVLDLPAVTDTETTRSTHGPAELVFENVSFRYSDTDPPALRDVSLRIAPGETLAVVGTTGSGKTTLAALIPGLHDPSTGRITLDGVDIAALPRAALRAEVAVAFDEPVLFSGTLADNVRMGVDDAYLDDALRSAHADDFVRGLPDGVHTRVGENGMSLSGGQRQRIALARLVIRRPRVVVLDDPLSALDVHTEAQIHDALREVLATTTALVIAHRPSTVALADRVAVLAEGRIIALGTHEELLRTSPEYAALMTPIDATA